MEINSQSKELNDILQKIAEHTGATTGFLIDEGGLPVTEIFHTHNHGDDMYYSNLATSISAAYSASRLIAETNRWIGPKFTLYSFRESYLFVTPFDDFLLVLQFDHLKDFEEIYTEVGKFFDKLLEVLEPFKIIQLDSRSADELKDIFKAELDDFRAKE